MNLKPDTAMPVAVGVCHRLVILRLTVTLALGLALGFVGRVHIAHACECSTPTWHISLDRVTSTDPAVDHQPHWDATATLSGSPEYLWFDSHTWRPDLIANLSLDP